MSTLDGDSGCPFGSTPAIATANGQTIDRYFRRPAAARINRVIGTRPRRDYTRRHARKLPKMMEKQHPLSLSARQIAGNAARPVVVAVQGGRAPRVPGIIACERLGIVYGLHHERSLSLGAGDRRKVS